jgi:(S)-3,5-dihydroxyphenylglycine transaminase
VLVEAECSLRAANREKIAFYRRNLALLLDALERAFPPSTRDGMGVHWNAPAGGFFVVLDVPFRADEALLERSAREFGVLWTPMSFFYADRGGERALRLSHSCLEPAQIDEGVRRLARLVEAVA